MIRNTIAELGIILAALLLIVLPYVTQADTTVIHNSTSASASTGGNYAGEGEVAEGNSSASASSEVWVNGKKVVDEHKEDNDDDGDGHAEVEIESEWSNDDEGNVSVNASATAEVNENSHETESGSAEEISDESEEKPNVIAQFIAYVFSLFGF